MTGSTLADIGCLDVLAGQPTQMVWCEGLTGRSQKDSRVIALPQNCRPHICQILLEPEQSTFADWYNAVSFAFSFTHCYKAMILVQVVYLQAGGPAFDLEFVGAPSLTFFKGGGFAALILTRISDQEPRP